MTADALPKLPFLPFALPEIGEEEIAEVVDTLRSGWVTTGPKAKRFEELTKAQIDETIREYKRGVESRRAFYDALGLSGAKKLQRGVKLLWQSPPSIPTGSYTNPVVKFYQIAPLLPPGATP